MKPKTLLTIITLLITLSSFGQSFVIDNCGQDTFSIMNNSEIQYIDSVFFAPYEIKKGELFSFTNGFDFSNKTIAFFDCGSIANNGYLTKKEFFKKILPEYHGPHGLTVLKEIERKETGYDAIITINCKMIVENELVKKLRLNLK